MSIDINWETATSGPDGEALAKRMQAFIHEKFQQVALPRFIRSVEVNSFDFGTVAPDLNIRDICDPFPDFYEEDEDGGDWSDSSDEPSPSSKTKPARNQAGETSSGINAWGADTRHDRQQQQRQYDSPGAVAGFDSDVPFGSPEHGFEFSPLRSPRIGEPLNPYFFPRAGTPGIPGGTSNLGYYMPRGGLSGTQTPLRPAGRGGDGFRDIPPIPIFNLTHPGVPSRPDRRHSSIDLDSGQSRPSTSGALPLSTIQNNAVVETIELQPKSPKTPSTSSDEEEKIPPPRRMREKKPEDFQVFCRLQYNGNMRLSLTAQILLDYPMPNFVGLPLKLNITGFTFDGVAVIAHIRRRVNLCFLSSEDADTLLGADEKGVDEDTLKEQTGNSNHGSSRRRNDSLLREIRVESEIGRMENGKQVLKNVGKVEKFILEQVRRIFEEEFVYPSFWTFLV
ncbi:Mitochondrial distribution and morphology protein 12 [Myotisia sp. PD_48]|nr:Mitochondrial distribution and morphology protein 12 [Myotisia sp. PD_48]